MASRNLDSSGTAAATMGIGSMPTWPGGMMAANTTSSPTEDARVLSRERSSGIDGSPDLLRACS